MSLSDYRYKELYKKISSTNYLLLKFTYVPNSSFKDRMPVITLPEMYYIMAECYNEKNDPVTAASYLNTVRTNRGISIFYKLPDTLTKPDVAAEIQREYRKEFVSEGQLFYFYKRRGNISIPGTAKVMDKSIYVLPIPQLERDMSSGQ